MTKRRTNKREAVQMILLICVILLIPLFFAIRSLAGQQGLEPTPVPTRTVAANAPGMTLTSGGAQAPVHVATNTLATIAQGKQPPACTFPLAQISEIESKAEFYFFSEPKIVLSHPDNLYNIVEWLPDNQRVLVTQDQYSTLQTETDKFLRQTIELYNPDTGDFQVYAIRHYIEEKPSWQPTLNSVVYPDMNYLGFDVNTGRIKFTRQVWVSYGDSSTAQLLADNLPQFAVAIQPDGKKMVYLENKQLVSLNASLKSNPSIAFDPAQWDYADTRRIDIPLSYEMVWKPGTGLLFLYGDGGERLSGYTYILDTTTGQVCELNLDGWAIKAKWSPNGRYLAIIRAKGPIRNSTIDVGILDTDTGQVYYVDIASDEIPGRHFVRDFVWAPDNRHLLAVGGVFPSDQSDDDHSRLYLADFITGQSVNLFPELRISANSGQSNLAWSFDGSKVLVRCPTIDDERVCLISVKK